MKKLYIAPETNVYKVNVLSSMMVGSVKINDGTISDDDFDPSRDNGTDDNTDNTVNRSNVWDNIW